MKIMTKIAKYAGHAGFVLFLVLFVLQQHEAALWSLLVGWTGYSVARISMLKRHASVIAKT